MNQAIQFLYRIDGLFVSAISSILLRYSETLYHVVETLLGRIYQASYEVEVIDYESSIVLSLSKLLCN